MTPSSTALTNMTMEYLNGRKYLNLIHEVRVKAWKLLARLAHRVLRRST
eukprot:CAMPEP_0184483162 /NCGR_PEP_ID=MMETSP0113_2-20130426/4789_1 /TAXON_ID=91329 /ORGANISM="Norrisiella sphaerica, Strain BC52" /LENGTH=48 /DNA_ID= /DNA_START= /DNA_END= /DNA_ORIENTATION=